MNVHRAMQNVEKISGRNYKILLDKKAVIFRVTKDVEKHVIFVAILHYLNSSEFMRLSDHTQYGSGNLIRAFLEYMNCRKADSLNDKTLLYPDYFNFVKRNKRVSVGTIWAKLHLVNRILFNYGEQNNEVLRFSYSRGIKGTKGIKKPKPSLSELFPDCPFSNFELIDSLRHVCSWIIIKQNEFRNELLVSQPVREALESIVRQYSHQSPLMNNFSYGAYKKLKSDDLKHQARVLYGEMLKQVLESDNDMLVERAHTSLVGKKKLDLLPLSHSAKKMKNVIKQFIAYDPKSNRNIVKFQNKTMADLFQNPNGEVGIFSNFNASSLICPTYCEKLALIFLLASDRVQTSTMRERLRLDDFLIDDGRLSYSIDKKRSTQDRPYSSPVYKRSSFVYQAFQIYLSLKLDRNHPSTLLFGDENESIWRFAFGPGVRNEYVFHTLSRPNSITSKQLISDIGKEKNAPFLWLLENQVERRQNYISYVALKDKCKNEGITPPPKPLNVSARCICVDNIGRSRVLLDGDVDSDEISAELTKHSPETKETIYKGRSLDKTQIKKQHQIAKIVGEEMLKDAQKLRFMLESTHVLDLPKASSLLGLKSPAESFNELIEVVPEGFDIGILGELSNSNISVVVQSNVTSALIQSYIKKIDQHLETAFNSNIEHYQILFTKKLYLTEILKQFTKDVVLSGQRLAERLDFSFPDLLESIS